MKSSMTRTLRRAGLAASAIVGALLVTACGAPRVHEVYRLSSLDDDGRSLSAAQQDLRKLALQARTIQPRSAAVVNDDSALAMLAPGNLQECTPEYLALFTGMSAFAPSGEQSFEPVAVAAQAGL